MRMLLAGLIVVLGVSLAWAEENIMYRCPMHPHYTAQEASQCPICGMDLVQVEKEANTSSQEGHAVVTIAPETIQNMGVRTQKVTTSIFGKQLRGYGQVVPNERRQKKIYSRVEGWISELAISAIGDEVTAGDLIYTIHSPDLLLAQHDLLALGSRPLSKLFIHYGVDKKFVNKLKKTRKVQDDVPYYSDYSGTVSALNIRPGSHVTLNQPLMVLEDYRSVWIEAQLAEQDLAFLNKGSGVEVSFPKLGDRTYQAQIDYIHPIIDADTRTGKVRLVLDNSEGQVKPGAYADIMFESNAQQRLTVPSEAILKTAQGDHVVVALGEGRFQPRPVHAGIHSQGRTEIMHGLKPGEEIVVSGQFLIDSESSLQASFRQMQAMPAESAGAHVGH